MAAIAHPPKMPAAEFGRTRTTRTAWLAHVGLTVGEWQADGARLAVISKGTNWWLGDWARFGATRYGQRYQIASEITGYDEQTLMNMVYVASRFSSSRRREKLSWSHHAEIAALPEDDQDAWLDRAERERLSVRELRAAVRAEPPLSARELAAGDELEPAAADGRDRQAFAVICPHCGDLFELSPGQLQSIADAGDSGHPARSSAN